MTNLDPAALQQLVQQLAPWLYEHAPLLTGAALVETAKGVAKAVGSDIWGKIKERFQRANKDEVITALESAPQHPGKRSKFEGELYELLEQDPAFAHELKAFLAQAAVTQTATQSGTGNKLVQNTGHHNNIS